MPFGPREAFFCNWEFKFLNNLKAPMIDPGTQGSYIFPVASGINKTKIHSDKI